MDLNELLFRQQIALIDASEAAWQGRSVQPTRLTDLAERIACLRAATGAAFYNHPLTAARA